MKLNHLLKVTCAVAVVSLGAVGEQANSTDTSLAELAVKSTMISTPQLRRIETASAGTAGTRSVISSAEELTQQIETLRTLVGSQADFAALLDLADPITPQSAWRMPSSAHAS